MLHKQEIEIVLSDVKTIVIIDAADKYATNAQVHARDLEGLLYQSSQFFPQNGIVIDVGANIGLSTMGLARLVPLGRVYAIEPSRRNACFLKANLARNNITNVVVVEAAASARAGTIEFTETGDYGAASHVSFGAAGTTVQTFDLDSFAKQHDLRSVDLIKIDAEGHEPWILAGAKSLIESARPKIWMEFNAWCLTAFGRVQPLVFAEALFQSFHAELARGNNLLPVGDTVSFLHNNMVRDGCVSDLLLDLKEHHRVSTSFGVVEGRAGDLSLEAENANLRQRNARHGRSWPPSEVRRHGVSLARFAHCLGAASGDRW